MKEAKNMKRKQALLERQQQKQQKKEQQKKLTSEELRIDACHKTKSPSKEEKSKQYQRSMEKKLKQGRCR